MKRFFVSALVALQFVWSSSAPAQMVMTGRVGQPRNPGSEERLLLPAILVFGSLDGPGAETLVFRTWETDPAGWFRLSGPAGNYTLLFSTPARFTRPLVMTNIEGQPGDAWNQAVTPKFDVAVCGEAAWDDKPASDYYQTFVAKGRSVTQVGFKLASDGVDGFGPLAQNLVVSIHRRGEGMPDTWPQVGPAIPVLNVDAGGAKNAAWSAGWESGEVPLAPGETYAVHLRAELPKGVFQAFWRDRAAAEGDCYRLGPAGKTGFLGKHLWMVISGDGDGLLIPYNKRVHREFGKFAGFRPKWSQTYVAQGRGLAGVILYAATSGVQPPLSRQRVAVRVRRGGCDGPVVGVEKIAVGNGLYTGDASWGAFGVAFAPGEVLLEPGQTYAVEFESIENLETLHGFVNIKHQVSDDRPGFNPYLKQPPDTYERGQAFANSAEAIQGDLDMQIVEYERAADHWAAAVDSANLLANGDFQTGSMVAEKPSAGRPDTWKTFSLSPETVHEYLPDLMDKNRRLPRITGAVDAKAIDGGYVQRVEGLNRDQTYRLSGRMRCSFAVDADRQCLIGLDPTGQDTDPNAPTIRWTTLPAVHGVFVPYTSDPARPADKAMSVWLRARSKAASPFAFKADFEGFALRRVRTGVPE
ncbi:MAG: hypothetical protein ACYC35_11300 [Pirellulales bacterium]